jgi:hypothetical protein
MAGSSSGAAAAPRAEAEAEAEEEDETEEATEEGSAAARAEGAAAAAAAAAPWREARNARPEARSNILFRVMVGEGASKENEKAVARSADSQTLDDALASFSVN